MDVCMKRIDAAFAWLHRQWLTGFLVLWLVGSTATFFLLIVGATVMVAAPHVGLSEQEKVWLILRSAVIWLPFAPAIVFPGLRRSNFHESEETLKKAWEAELAIVPDAETDDGAMKRIGDAMAWFVRQWALGALVLLLLGGAFMVWFVILGGIVLLLGPLIGLSEPVGAALIRLSWPGWLPLAAGMIVPELGKLEIVRPGKSSSGVQSD